MNFGQLKTRVQRRIIDLPAAITAEVPDLVNEAIRDLEDFHNFHVMRAITSANTVVDTRLLLPAPADFKNFRNAPWRENATGNTQRLATTKSRDEAVQAFGEREGSPHLLLHDEEDVQGQADIEVFPLPDGTSDFPDGEYRINIPYWRFLPELTSDSQTNWFTNNAAQYIIDKATAEGFALNWDEARAAFWEQKASQRRAQVLNLDKRFWIGDADTFVYHTGARMSRVERP